MNKCPQCGTEFEGKFCPECGNRWQEEKTCPKCGAHLSGGAKFCNNCGFAFTQQTPEKKPEAKKQTVTTESKLYRLLYSLPALLLGLFAVLLFAFLAAPAVTANVFGLSGSDSGYEILKDPEMKFLQASYIALIAFACIAFIAACISAYRVNEVLRQPSTVQTVVSEVFYLVLFIIACVAIGKVNSFDNGAGVLSAGACPILILVFAPLFAAGNVISLIFAKRVSHTTEKEVKAPNKVFQWIGNHKKLVGALTVFAIIVVVIGSCIPTFLLMGKNGTYYACYNGEINEESYIILKNGKWTDDSGASGKYSVSGNKITVRIPDALTNTTVTLNGTVKNGVLKLEGEGRNITCRTRSHTHKFNSGFCACGIGQLEYTLIDGAYSVKIGEAWKNSTKIEIPAEYNHLPVTSIEMNAFKGCYELKSITIPESITSIGENAFDMRYQSTYYGHLKNIYYTGDIAGWCGISGLGSLIESYRTIYINGKKLTGKLIIPDGVTEIGGCAFYGCSGLTSVTVPNSVTKIGSSAFRDCSSLKSINIPDSVTEIGWGAFYDCSSLKSVTIPDSVTEIGDSAFNDCSSLKSVTIGNGVTEIVHSAFYDCSSLKSITIPNSVTKIGSQAFARCNGLTSITIPDSVTEIGNEAFARCNGLTSITIPDSVTKIGSSAFYDCSKLIQIENGVQYVDKWVIDCDSNVTSVSLRSNIVGIGDSAFYGCSSLMSITIPNSVTSIGDSAFYRCSGLTSITIPNSVTSINRYAFWNCSGLTSITYNGTKAEWNAVIKGTSWDSGTSDYTVHCTDGDIEK